MQRYITPARFAYQPEQVWFPLSEAIGEWDEDFHELMLNDHLRMTAYEAAIKEVVKPGMVVADIGTGTGILAQWALEAGAERVYGIEMNTEILAKAEERLEKAGLIQCFQARLGISYDITLPERVDVVVSELLGNLGDNEAMEPILYDAHERFLKPEGVMVPQEVEVFLMPVDAPSAYEQVRLGQCRTLNANYDLSRLMQQLESKSRFDIYYDVVLPRSTHLSDPKKHWKIKSGHLQTTLRTTNAYRAKRAGQLTGFKGYFIARLSPNVILDISGDDIVGSTTSDCWKHAYLPIEEPIGVEPGDWIELNFYRYQRLPDRWDGEVTQRRCFNHRMERKEGKK